MEFVVPLLVGLAVGVVVGALGAGGGILSVPILVFLLAQDPYAAAASSLVIVAFTAVTSIGHHARHRNVRWKAGLTFGALSVIGAFAGSRLSVLVPPDVLMFLFAGMLAVVAVAMFRRAAATRRDEHAAPPAAEPDGAEPDGAGRDEATTDDAGTASAGPSGIETVAAEQAPAAGSSSIEPPSARGPLAVVVAATATGFLTGFFGVGGGFIVVPILVMVLRLGIRSAAGTSLLVMIIASVAGLLSRIGTPVQVDWLVTALFTAGSAIGGLIGGPVSARVRPSTLTFVFAALLAAVAVFTAVQTALGTV